MDLTGRSGEPFDSLEDAVPNGRCRTCLFWCGPEGWTTRRSDQAGGYNKSGSARECRRNPPMVLVHAEASDSFPSRLITAWPMTDPDEGCGEWMPRSFAKRTES